MNWFDSKSKKKSINKTINDSLSQAKVIQDEALNFSNVEVLSVDELYSRSFSLNSCLVFFATYFSTYKTELLRDRPNALQSWTELMSSYIVILKLDGIAYLINTGDGLFVVRYSNLNKEIGQVSNTSIDEIKKITYSAMVIIGEFNLQFTKISWNNIQSVFDVGTSFTGVPIKRIDSLEELLTGEVMLAEGYKNILGLTGGLWISPKQGKDSPSLSGLEKIGDAMKSIVGMTNTRQLVKITTTPIDVTSPIVDFSKFMPKEMFDKSLSTTASKFNIQKDLLNGGATYENMQQSLLAFQTMVLEGENVKFISALNNLKFNIKTTI